ncbi:AI-2E family transporter [Novosphingobium sp. PY1]|uniref:AI-2E family transporter n=1 Tax=Novosphingobium sp. PY1 TaxID=1882221 RepID=UPI001A8CE8C9|nr:AI-2E family transporter [Novosphingobium sp. PY1]
MFSFTFLSFRGFVDLQGRDLWGLRRRVPRTALQEQCTMLPMVPGKRQIESAGRAIGRRTRKKRLSAWQDASRSHAKAWAFATRQPNGSFFGRSMAQGADAYVASRDLRFQGDLNVSRLKDHSISHRHFIERLLIVAAFVLIVAFLWSVKSLLVAVAGAAVLSVLLRSIADPLGRWTGLGSRAGTAMAVVVLLGVLGCAGWLFGATVAVQLAHLSTALPTSWNDLDAIADTVPFGEQALTSLESELNLPSLLPQLFRLISNAATDLTLIFFGAVFFAAQPQLYKRGLLKLVPSNRRSVVSTSLGDAHRALRLWLLGQVISMIVVGVLTGLGLWLAGVPSALALGLIAGLTEGIPYLGPIIGSLPGILLALLESPQTALWALLVYVAVQQIEGNTLVPIIHREFVDLPPALTLFSIIAAGLVFGVIGVIFATPMLVVVYVMIKRLYVREALDTKTSLPGEPEAPT